MGSEDVGWYLIRQAQRSATARISDAPGGGGLDGA